MGEINHGKCNVENNENCNCHSTNLENKNRKEKMQIIINIF